MNDRTVIITGGHLTPALAVIDVIKKRHPSWRLIFFGRNETEKNSVSERGVEYISSKAARRSSVWGVLTGIFQAYTSVRQENPHAVISFGGYVGFAMAFAAALRGVPVIVHEQTHTAGLANRLVARFARRVCVSFEDSAKIFPLGKTIVTGLPVRDAIIHPVATPPFALPKQKPILFITGGSIGARSMNDALFPALPVLIKQYTVVHQTGRESFGKALCIDLPGYLAKEYVDERAMGWLLAHADVVISRSGANTVMELAVAGAKSVLVPLPWSAGNEQEVNAAWLVSLGLATVLPQHAMTRENIEKALFAAQACTGQKKASHEILVATVLRAADRVTDEVDAIL